MIETVKRMVTSCPECDTHFYVKPEQLAVRKGFVRCGHCQHRFNALDFMLPERELQIDFSRLDKLHRSVAQTSTEDKAEETYTPIALEDAITSMPLYKDAIVDAPNAPIEASTDEESAELEADNQALTHEEITNEEITEPEASLPQADAHQVDENEFDAHQFDENQPQADVVINTEPESLTESSTDTEVSTQEDSPVVVVLGAASANTDFTNDFARKGRFKSKQSSKAVTWLLKTLAAILLLLAVGQALYFGRTMITSYIPNVKPYFEEACGLIGCVIELPHDITKISIDDSDLKEDLIYQGLIHVSATMINQAEITQAYPSLELTLTDEDNKPLLRRIFQPSEYVEKATVLKSGLPPNQEVYVSLDVSVIGSAVVGYRLLPRYN